MLTAKGLFKIVSHTIVSETGRITQGVKAIKLEEDDYLICAEKIEEKDSEIISITKEGFCARISINSFFYKWKNYKRKITSKRTIKEFYFCF